MIIMRKLKGATLLEVLVAISIIIMVLTVSTMVFVNVTGSSFTNEKLNASLILNEVSFETKRDKTFFDDEVERDGIVIKKQIDKYNNQQNLIWIYLSAYSPGNKLLMERKEIILVENE